MVILKAHAIAAAGSGQRLGRVLGVSRQAVSKWGDALPELYVYRLRARKPAWYRQAVKLAQAA